MHTKFKYLFYIIGLGIFTIFLMQACNGSHSDDTATEDVWKDKLSEFRFFDGNLHETIPAADVHPYNITTPLFTDYTVKERFIKLPDGSSMKYVGEGLLNFPDSTFLIKHFGYRNENKDTVWIETRVMFKKPGSDWDVMDYVWNDEQTEATKFIRGAKVPITLLDDNDNAIRTNYQIPNVNDCIRCHINNNVVIPIGPKARNLNFTRKNDEENQLQIWADHGILADLPSTDQIPTLPVWDDSTHYSIPQRARAYLDVNCSYCHTSGGDAYNTGLYLEYQQEDSNHIGIMKFPVSAGGGAGGLDYDIVPGHPEKSILYHRMNSTEPGTAMPELTRTIIHKEGVRLIAQWINEMK